jgi:hypothetical protein
VIVLGVIMSALATTVVNALDKLSGDPKDGASRTRTGDLLGAIQRRGDIVGVDGPTITRGYW